MTIVLLLLMVTQINFQALSNLSVSIWTGDETELLRHQTEETNNLKDKDKQG